MKKITKHFKIDRNYVSETDQFLIQFDHCYPQLSNSQQKEIAQYRHLFNQRDIP
jgi:hypothetical protein